MSWYNPATWFYGDDADTYAANVAAQRRILLSIAETAEPAAYKRAYDTFVANYGPLAASDEEQLTRARGQYMADINAAADQGFLDGVKEAPALISGAVGSTIAAFWSGMPAWLKWAVLGALALFALHLATRAGETYVRARAVTPAVTPPAAAPRKKKIKAAA